MKQPLIGLLPMVDYENQRIWVRPGYMQSVSREGGLPVMLPLTEDPTTLVQLSELCDGFVLTGGADLDPSLYGQEALPACYPPCKELDRMELKLLELALKADKPVLGICRGMQLINVALGGTLYQDLPTQHPSEIRHTMEPPFGRPVHRVTLLDGAPIQKVMGCGTLDVNSDHHQAVLELAPELSAMAWAEDGVVEAIYQPRKRFVWGVQWHPEAFPETAEHRRKLFAAFLEAVREESA